MKDEAYSEAETVKRRESALKRMLATPHKPHDPQRIRRHKKKQISKRLKK